MWITLPIVGFLVMLSGLFSGLTLGLMGLDLIGLQIVQKGDNEELAKCAAKIEPLREKGNQLLCTLLLGNVAVNSALSILMADLADGIVGFLASTALIVLLGEILPQAVCARYALQIGARTVPIVKLLMIIFYVLAKPISMVLDLVLGEEIGTVHSRQELMEMLRLQISMGAADAVTGAMAEQVVRGALNFRDKKVEDLMTKVEDAYMLSVEARLGYDLILEIFKKGYSRIPVYGKDKDDFRGLLVSKDLMLVDPEDEIKVGDLIPIFNRRVETFTKTTVLADVLNAFKRGGTHIGIVREIRSNLSGDSVALDQMKIVGVLTLEDIMEEILHVEITDETDICVDVERNAKMRQVRDEGISSLGVFYPIWRQREPRLTPAEVAVISAHLAREVFGNSLSYRAIEWLVSSAKLQFRALNFPDQGQEDDECIYMAGERCDRCTLVLEGEILLTVGKEALRSTVGPFSVLARYALFQDGYEPDFSARMHSQKVRLVVMTRAQYLEAKTLDNDNEGLEIAMGTLASTAAGYASRYEAKGLRAKDSR